MNLFDVYPRFEITPTTAEHVYVYDEKGNEYLDLYGGHGVISIGHSHPHYVKRLKQQLDKIGFYSNSIRMPIQVKLAKKLGQLSGYSDYELFLCNSGAEANENALKLASFHNGKRKIIAFNNSFHGRTAATLNVTDNLKLSAPINKNNFPVEFIELNNSAQLQAAFKEQDVCAVILEGIQGVGGLDYATSTFLEEISQLCNSNEALLIVDEIQSGFGRSGKFFAHQHAGIKADIISMAKGMGNGFPVGGLLINPKIKASSGLLGTTFGGNHLACAASLAVLEIIKKENLMKNAFLVSQFIRTELAAIPSIKNIKGKGLMLGVEFDFPIKELRNKILFEDFIFTGASVNPKLLRILPPLCINEEEVLPFIKSLKKHLK